MYSIREAAVGNLAQLARLFGPAWTTANVVPSVIELHREESYLCRLTCLHAVQKLAEVLEEDVFNGSMVKVVW